MYHKDCVAESFAKSLENLGMEYVDLVGEYHCFIHFSR